MNLNDLYGKSESHGVLFDHLSTYQRNMAATTVDTLEILLKGAKDPHGDVLRFFRDLEDLGAGRFIAGRRGHPSRFEWSTPLTEVASQASSGKQNVPFEPLSIVGDNSPSGSEVESHPFKLRPDLWIRIPLPKDLRKLERRRLSEFVLSLPTIDEE